METNSLVKEIEAEILAKLALYPETSGVMRIECFPSQVDLLRKALSMPKIQAVMKTNGVTAELIVVEPGEKLSEEEKLVEMLTAASFSLILCSQILAKFINKSPLEIRRNCEKEGIKLMSNMTDDERHKFLLKHFPGGGDA